MTGRGSLFCSSIGKKYVMGITGLIWAGFVLAHMAGNMLIFFGPNAYNLYGHALTSGNLIYAVEAVLIISLVLHVVMALRLSIENKKARPVRYTMDPNGLKAPPTASQTMLIHGSIILAFIVYHLITFKFGAYYEVVSPSGVVMRDLFRLMVEVFNSPIYVVGYVGCMILLGLHLSHGFGSVFQTFGLNHPSYAKKIKALSMAYAFIVAGGFISQPIYIYFFVK